MRFVFRVLLVYKLAICGTEFALRLLLAMTFEVVAVAYIIHIDTGH